MTLRVCDVHLAESSREVGCEEPGPHVHVRGREDIDGGAVKSLDPRVVPADELVVFCLDRYLLERAAVSEAVGCDRLLVNLEGAYRGRGMTPDRLGALLRSLSRRAGLKEVITPHRLRHTFASELEASGAGLVVIQQLLGHRQITSTQVERGLRVPAGVVEGQELAWHARPRHQLRSARRGRPRAASLDQFGALVAACGTWRDRSILALLGKAG